MSKFFISYSHKDADFASKIRTSILRVDTAHEVFLDRFGLSAGSNIKQALAKRIEWCDYLILILSQSSLKSKWVAFEIREIQKSERKTGEKKLFVIEPMGMKINRLPRSLANNLILQFFSEPDFPADFFRLMHAIYEKPTFYDVGHTVANDAIEGYLCSLQIACDDEFLQLIECVEYRFDYEFYYENDYNEKILDGPVHVATNRRGRFGIRNLWTNQPITVFVSLYLKNTRAIYIRKFIDVGSPAN